MKSAETCSCSLCNKLYTYLYHYIVVLDKYIQSNLVYYKHNEDDESYVYVESMKNSRNVQNICSEKLQGRE